MIPEKTKVLIAFIVLICSLNCQKRDMNFPAIMEVKKPPKTHLKLIELSCSRLFCRFENRSSSYDSLVLWAVVPMAAMKYHYNKRIDEIGKKMKGEVSAVLEVNSKGRLHELLNFESQLLDKKLNLKLRSMLENNYWGECKNENGIDTIKVKYLFSLDD